MFRNDDLDAKIIKDGITKRSALLLMQKNEQGKFNKVEVKDT